MMPMPLWRERLRAIAELLVRISPHLLALALLWRAASGTAQPFAWVGMGLVGLPFAEWIVGRATPGASSRGRPDRLAAQCLPWCWLPLQMALVLVSLDCVRTARMSITASLTLAVPVGILAGVFGMTAAHELLHRRGTASRWGAGLLLMLAGYPHFRISHRVGHHRWVGTPADAATARLDESLYAFLPRSIAGGFRTAWRHEQRRLGRRPVNGGLCANRVASGLCAFGLCLVAATLFAGLAGLTFLLCQAAIAVSVLEGINYIQHYGLAAARRRAHCAQPHSWDCDFLLTNLLLHDLGRHPAHHAGPPQQLSRPVGSDSPALPAGYFTCFLLALLPSLWHQLMDSRATRWLEREEPAFGPPATAKEAA